MTRPMAAALAAELLDRYASPAIRNHSHRSFSWAVDHANRHQLNYDAELLSVAALLHDVALTPFFDNHTVAFEEASAHIARVFSTGAGWPAARTNRLAEVIILHMRDDVPPDVDPEAHLLQVGVSFDVSGIRHTEFDQNVLVDVLTHFPRLDFANEFGHLLADQATRKPTSAAATLVTGGIAARIAVNPLDR